MSANGKRNKALICKRQRCRLRCQRFQGPQARFAEELPFNSAKKNKKKQPKK